MGFSVIKTYLFDVESSVGGNVTQIPLGGGWYNDGPQAPISQTENGELVHLFADGVTQYLYRFIRVPQNYNGGKQINLNLGFYSPSTSGTVKMKATTYLLRQNVDAISSTSLSYVSTNTALTLATTANKLMSASLDLTNSSGVIGSTTVVAGDLLRVQLERDVANDTDTADVRFIPSSTECIFAN